MTVTYACYICDPFGVRLADASNFVSLRYSRIVNDVGTLTIELPATFPEQYIRIPDGRIEVWRRLDGGREYLDTDTIWLIQRRRRKRDASGNVTIILEAETPLRIFGTPGRIAYGFAGTSAVTFGNGAADNHIKNVVINNIGVIALSPRQLTQYISIQPSTGQGASVSKAFAWRECLVVMQELAQASTTAGTYVAFDIVSPTPDTMQFQTFVQQRGNDHRWPSGNNPLVLSPEFGNLGESEMIEDYGDMASVVVIGGAGQGSARTVTSVQDTTLQGLSPFGYREKFTENTQSADIATLQGDAQAALRAARPRLTYTGKILETPDTRYGVQWGWGDYVTVQDFKKSLDCRIEAVTVTVKPGINYETVEAWLRSEQYV